MSPWRQLPQPRNTPSLYWICALAAALAAAFAPVPEADAGDSPGSVEAESDLRFAAAGLRTFFFTAEVAEVELPSGSAGAGGFSGAGGGSPRLSAPGTTMQATCTKCSMQIRRR